MGKAVMEDAAEDDPGIKQTQGMQEEIHFDNVSCQYISTSSGHND